MGSAGWEPAPREREASREPLGAGGARGGGLSFTATASVGVKPGNTGPTREGFVHKGKGKTASTFPHVSFPTEMGRCVSTRASSAGKRVPVPAAAQPPAQVWP